ncbi:hypothetical protein [Photobacterium lutimaris]|uniref:Uncharacterized protein n=1 Tax=Photobacterium lutimaris TaxID=388278 RepID=A0A2T3ITX0_9GAMM|nr:hypothetical protein [Photobacterium lutimaris]PSU31809.1 hypothetical protein C9I99_21735 [Photobacterium lutimaris]TDR72539.1 hypothetical protein DFP78_11315 [Photobacterium lutimaris]
MKTNFKNQKTMLRSTKRQRGLTTIDYLLGMVGVALFIGLVMQFYPQITHSGNMSSLNSHISQIQRASTDWKGLRSNFTGIGIDTPLCSSNYLNDSICGDDGSASNSNPWGSSYTIVANTNPSLIDVTIAGIHAGFVQQVADRLAPLTADNCAYAGDGGTDCATVSISGQDVTITL